MRPIRNEKQKTIIKALREAEIEIRKFAHNNVSDLGEFNYAYACGAAMALEQIAEALNWNDLGYITNAIEVAKASEVRS